MGQLTHDEIVAMNGQGVSQALRDTVQRLALAAAQTCV
jgi:hypothetical protein